MEDEFELAENYKLKLDSRSIKLMLKIYIFLDLIAPEIFSEDEMENSKEFKISDKIQFIDEIQRKNLKIRSLSNDLQQLEFHHSEVFITCFTFSID